MRRLLTIAGLVAAVAAAVAWWRQNRRFGVEFMNRVLNPALMRRRLAGAGRSELGTLEHIGRTTGTRRLTPVHPEATADGFRIIVPLGGESQWARNVLAAGHCRLQLHDTVYELDEPKLISPDEAEGLPRPVKRVATYLGFQYLALRTFASAHGELSPDADVAVPEAASTEEPVKPRRKRAKPPSETEPEPAPAAV